MNLFTNLCTNQCVFDTKLKIIKRQNIPIRGLTKILPKLFFKGYKKQAQPNRGKNPRKYGIMYDYHINSILQNIHKTSLYNKLPIEHFTNNKDIIYKSLLRFPKTRFTCPIVDYMIKHSLIPIYAQYPVAHFSYNFGTCIDLICLSVETNKLVVIENKTGYIVNYNKSIGTMQEPFTFLPNSQVNQHLVYLAICTYMLKNSGLLVDPTKSAVLRLNESNMSLDEYKLSPRLYDDQVMYDALKVVSFSL